jgi:hypothetical protein
MDHPAIYQIQVQGQLDPSWSDWLGGLAIQALPGGDSLLTGQVIDRAALQSLLDKIYRLNLVLISVSRIADGDTIIPISNA